MLGQIKIEKPTKEKLDKLKIDTWETWECGPSDFDWEYTSQETFYVKQGKVIVDLEDGKAAFGKGDLVTFPAGCRCTWHVKEKVTKVYTFENIE